MNNVESFFSYDKKELFTILLDLLNMFNTICNRYGLRYYAQGGTMLGAIRHNGFIPWDDDIDLAMMRCDYDKLLELIPQIEMPVPYRFLTPLTDMQYGKGIIRLCNTNTTAIPVHDAGFEYNNGIFIDIFPLDAIPDNKIRFLIYRRKMKAYHSLLLLSARYYSPNGNQALSHSHKLIYYILLPFFKLHIINKSKVFSSYTKAVSHYKNKGQKRICLATFRIIPKYINLASDYNVEIIEVPFENTTIPMPNTYDKILKIHFGEKYMTPVKEKTNHGDMLISTSIPYSEFRAIYNDDLSRLWVENKRGEK